MLKREEMTSIRLKRMVRTLKYDLLDIKKYKSCKDCGKCCGPVPITEEDIKKIRLKRKR